ncbi:uncharacterized protein FIBRA_02867 [Fibroporia radiculosa]|uniref:DUF302 domain-containing protein n=1 Tax=Fibroporia radiculosa TaxID=599839 RepID=J4GN60_9APHY|nr:uncharacterized protein FIBRA_02867 [Fibroporia radiculosa]CCM00825.1 predicted protein [Fibroporia radiculosa]
MSKTIHETVAKRIVFTTSLPVAEIVARLDKELNRDKPGPTINEILRSSKTRDEQEQKIGELSGGKDFVFFGVQPHHVWRNVYRGTTSSPKTYQYVLGNPLIAETMFKHDLYTGLHVPPRILVAEKADGSGTEVVYILPSTIIAIPIDGKVNAELKAAAEALDEKLEQLVRRVTSV